MTEENTAELRMVRASVQKGLENNEIEDSGVYVLSPDYRLRNEARYVLLNSNNGSGYRRLEKVYGIVLALLDGKRTVQEVARAVTPFTKNPKGEAGFTEALNQVKTTILLMSKTHGEHLGRPHHPIIARPRYGAVIPLSLLTHWSGLRAPIYDPVQFLPRKSPPHRQTDFADIREPRPVGLKFHLTSDCATDCRYCYLKRRPLSHEQLLSKQRMLELIQECADIEVLDLVVGGGDPLLYPHLLDVLDAVTSHRNCSVISFSTKAFLSREMAASLAQYAQLRVGELQFSIDSTVRDVADYLTRRPGFCERTMMSIDNALAAGLPVTVKAVVTPYNILTLPKFYIEMRSRGVKNIRMATYVRSFFHHTDDLFNSVDSFKWLQTELRKLEEELACEPIDIQGGVPLLNQEPAERKKPRFENRARCSAGRSSMMICADGKVIACEQMPETEDSFCGDLKHQSIMDVWNSPALLRRSIDFPREEFRGTPCETCEEWDKGCLREKGYCIRDQVGYYGKAFDTPFACPKSQHAFVRTQ